LTVRDYYDKVIIKFIKEEITMKRSVFKAERYKFFLAFLLFFAGSLTLLSQSKSFGKVEYAPLPQSQPVDEETKSNILSAFWKAPLHFVANDGQLPDEVAYYAKSEGATVYCTEEGLVFGFAEGSISLKFNAIVDPSMSLRGAKRRSNLEAQKELSGKVNYFIGNDPALWRTNIPTFAEVVYKEVYPGIDLVYSGNQRRLKYTFYLEPGADATQIEMTYDGIESLSVDDDTGELVIQTQWCPKMRDAKPVAYQEIDGVRREVSISFRLIDEKKVGFAVGNYDPKFRLTIDPGYSTYLGGSGSDYGYGIAVDSSGNAYVVGHTTNSTNFPTQSPFQGTYGGGNYDTFVTKLNISGSALEYSTYLGGSNWDEGFGIAVDSSGNAYVTGRTYSTNFPTQNPYQGTHGGGGLDAFVTKLNSAGSALSYSTYLGGSGDDGGFDIAVDSSGNAYVAGYTFSTNFPTQNPYQDSKGGDVDAFVTRLNISGSTLEYSTYLGGSSYDYGIGIAVDSSGNAYVVGHTASTNFPTQSPYQGTFGGGSYDAFIASFFSDGSLPVELSLFTVTASEDGVTIRWRTETETNNLGFNIYRSDTKDGNYIKVNATLILGAGTDATPHDYSFIDENVVKGLTYYYYIEDVDFTGKTNISHILEVTVAEIARVREGAKPPKFALFQNFPNPFNPDTWIPYDVASDAVVIIRIYNTNGQLVRQMELGKQKAGSYVDKKKAAYWDGKDQSGNAVASGVYFYTLKAGDFQATRRMVIVK
jgi:hypothetical protein